MDELTDLKADIETLGYDWIVFRHADPGSGEKYRCDITKHELESDPFLVGQGFGSTEIEAVGNALEAC